MGEAGGSADRRAEELRARGLKSAGAWAAGAVGERRVAEALAELPPEWLVLHDRLLFPGRSETNLDHVLVGPAGVVLIDAKNWAGNLTEWEGGLFKHQFTSSGQRRHVPVHQEVDSVMRMGTEMARRVQVPVTVVVALAGAQADDFGEPRLVRNVWVVPVKQLVHWLSTRPVIDADHAQRLGVLVRTEFPSTTTDWRLLAAMGHDLDRRGLTPGMPARRTRAARRTPSRSVAVGPPAPRTQPRSRRRGAWLRPVGFLVGVGALMWALQAGVVTDLGAALSSALAGRVSQAAGGVVAAEPLDTALSCADFDPSSVKQLRKLHLTAQEASHTCSYQATVSKRAKAVLIIKESHTYYPMTKPLAASKKAHGPVVSVSDSLSGKLTLLHVAKGETLKDGKTAAPAGRDLEVLVAHEALGLTAKQGRQLAIRIAMGVHGPPQTPGTTATD